MARVHPAVYDALSKLCAIPHTTVVIFSGSGRARLEETFQGLPLWLAAENGVFVRPAPSVRTWSGTRWSRHLYLSWYLGFAVKPRLEDLEPDTQPKALLRNWIQRRMKSIYWSLAF